MQAKDIKLNESYAVSYRGGEVALRVIELRNVRDHNGTKNYVVGFTPALGSDTPGTKLVIEVKDVIDELTKHSALQQEQMRREAAQRANAAERKRVQDKAVAMLAEAIGAQKVLGRYQHSDDYVEWDDDGPAVLRDSRGLEVNEKALPLLIEFLGWASNVKRVQDYRGTISDYNTDGTSYPAADFGNGDPT